MVHQHHGLQEGGAGDGGRDRLVPRVHEGAPAGLGQLAAVGLGRLPAALLRHAHPGVGVRGLRARRAGQGGGLLHRSDGHASRLLRQVPEVRREARAAARTCSTPGWTRPYRRCTTPSGCGTRSKFKKLYPMSMRPQSHDIIRTWAFYTILREYLITGQRPWNDIMIHGFIMAPDGTPMHTSLGNVIDPMPMLARRTVRTRCATTPAPAPWARTTPSGRRTSCTARSWSPSCGTWASSWRWSSRRSRR